MIKIANYNYATGLKKCSKCEEDKELNLYGQYKHKTSKKLYYYSQCRKCRNLSKTLKWNTPEFQERRKVKLQRVEKARKLRRETTFEEYQKYLECGRKRRSDIKNKDPELYYRKQKNNYLKSKYGITIEEYENLAKNQDNKCVICKNELQLVVDHCHKSGEVRGLLCSDCNSGIGLLKEDINYLEGAINYIKSWNNVI